MNCILSVFFSSLLIFAQQCGKESVTDAMPVCVQERVREILKDDVWNPPAKIYSYFYDGKTVYFIPQRCCDFPSELYDEDCKVVCQPDGGFSGGGDGRCTDFFTKRTAEKLIWEDTRK